jgi:hypothetical protein
VTPERVLQQRPLVLAQRERERYFADGVLTVPGYVDSVWLARLRAVVTEKIEASRALTASDEQRRAPCIRSERGSTLRVRWRRSA